MATPKKRISWGGSAGCAWVRSPGVLGISFPATQSPELAQFVNREAEGRVTPDLSTRLPKVEHPDDVKAVVSVLLDTQDDDTVRHEAANLLPIDEVAGQRFYAVQEALSELSDVVSVPIDQFFAEW